MPGRSKGLNDDDHEISCSSSNELIISKEIPSGETDLKITVATMMVLNQLIIKEIQESENKVKIQA